MDISQYFTHAMGSYLISGTGGWSGVIDGVQFEAMDPKYFRKCLNCQASTKFATLKTLSSFKRQSKMSKKGIPMLSYSEGSSEK